MLLYIDVVYCILYVIVCYWVVCYLFFCEEFFVHLVDYGDKEVISLSNLRPLTANFCQLPAQALKARLAGVEPKNGDML